MSEEVALEVEKYEGRDNTYQCKICGQVFIITRSINYCYSCGQRLSWEVIKNGEN